MSFDMEELYEKATSLMNEEKYDEAKPISEKILSYDSEHLPSLNELGRYYLIKKDYQKSEDFFLKLLTLIVNTYGHIII